MTIKLLKDLNFADKQSVAEPVTEAAQNVVKNYRGYLFMNAANCAVVNNFIREAQQYAYDKGMAKILDGVMAFINDDFPLFLLPKSAICVRFDLGVSCNDILLWLFKL